MFRLVSFLSLRLTPAYPGRKTHTRAREAQQAGDVFGNFSSILQRTDARRSPQEHRPPTPYLASRGTCANGVRALPREAREPANRASRASRAAFFFGTPGSKAPGTPGSKGLGTLIRGQHCPEEFFRPPPGFRDPGFEGFRDSGFKGFTDPGFKGLRDPGLKGLRGPWFRGFRGPWFKGFRDPGFTGRIRMV